MARLRTLLQLRTSARRASDQENSLFVSDAEANDWINQSAARWYAMIAGANPHRYAQTTTIATVSGTTSYALPANFASILGVDRHEGDRRFRLEPYSWQERSADPVWSDTGRCRYRVQGSLGDQADGLEVIVFDPDPGRRTYTVHYISAPAPLAGDAETVDGVYGWDEWIVFDVASRMAAKAEDLDLSRSLIAERDVLGEQIKIDAAHRDMGSAPQVADVRRRRRNVPRMR